MMQTKTFALDMNKLIAKAGRNAEAVVRKIALETYSKIVIKSPVDTGRLRGNWNVGINNADMSEQPAISSPTPAKALTALAGFKLGDKILITNHLPYVHKLEYGLYGAGDKTVNGFSKQAPQGFVRITYKEIASSLENIGRKVIK